MKRMALSLAAVLALAGSVTPLRATETVTACMIQAVKDCDARFPPGDYYNAAIRGWCYMIQTGMCKLLD